MQKTNNVYSLKSSHELDVAMRLSFLEREIEHLKKSKTKLLQIRERNLIRCVPIDDIILVKSSSNYSFIYLKGGKEIFTSKTLKYWQDQINEENFSRCHSSYLINRNEILEIFTKTQTLKMSNGMTAKCSRKINAEHLGKAIVKKISTN
ncbi:MAG TPA: LytTR family DNA-binding domain-containing protein [Saprospiraceae bacterium]|nr:LytTR family DNA-binding domain-containing protein [Saprospiraceae bacterium]HPN71241.1 LytTR family DNA-binding domain-containing protein [Saprospiraceae bacterium]